MTGTAALKRTSLNIELSRYFKEQLPGYLGVFEDNEGEDVLNKLNQYPEENNIEKPYLEYPISSGDNVYLIPIAPNLQLEVVAVDEYYGGEDYARYVAIKNFVINNQTTREDVDELIALIKRLF